MKEARSIYIVSGVWTFRTGQDDWVQAGLDVKLAIVLKCLNRLANAIFCPNVFTFGRQDSVKSHSCSFTNAWRRYRVHFRL